MPKKGASQAKNAIKAWLEEHCQQNSAFKRNLLILYKQKKYKDIATAIKKDYLNGKSSAEATNFLQNSQHVVDIMKHVESCDLESKSGNNTSGKRTLTSDDSEKEKDTNTKKAKKTVEVKDSEEFDEDEMTSFLDKADDDAMKRFYAEEEDGEVEEDEDELFVKDNMYDLDEDGEEEEKLKYGDFFKP